MLLSQALVTPLSKGPGRPAFEFLGKAMTYGDLSTLVGRLSYLLQKEIGSKQRVGIIGSNSPVFLTSFLALSNCRCILIPIDPELSDDDIAQWIYETRPTTLLVTNDMTARIQDLVRRRNMSITLMEIERKKGGEYATAYVPPPDNPPADTDPILILRTSGTAGKRKYCMFNHLQVQAAVTALKPAYKSTGSDRFLTTLNYSNPFAFLHGLLFPILSGNTCIVDHGHDYLEVLDFIHKSKVTRLVDMPEFFQKLLIVCHSKKTPLRGVQSATVGYGGLDATASKVYGMMKTAVMECYGQTENLWTIAMGGQGIPGVEYKVLDANGDPITTKGVREGPLAIMSKSVMMRYEAVDEKVAEKDTQESIRGTWLYTGDICKLEAKPESTSLTFIRRKDGLHQKRTRDAYDPEKIRRAFESQEQVAMAHVFQHENKTCCAVILKEGITVSAHQLTIDAKQSLSPKNIPQNVKVLEILPKDEAGQLDFNALLVAMGFEVPEEKKTA